MEALKGNLEEVEIGSSVESFRKLLDSQQELFHSQIDQLQRLVVTQCNLTGANPLSQEMAAGALSIKIGKRPRDLLNPKAVKYMQEIFSIKDAISKKESREISALFGVRVTQVREFFCSQRTRVRKLVRLSREEASKVTMLGESKDSDPKSHASLMTVSLLPLNSVSSNPGSLVSVSHDSLPLNSVSPSPPDIDYLNSIIANPIPLNSINHNPVPFNLVIPNPVPLNSIGPSVLPVNSIGTSKAEEAPSCSTQDEALPGLDNSEKDFVQNIFGLLHREETFSGQVKLMEWILRIRNPSVLYWFLVKGGAMILATWLTEAAVEEQTSVLVVTLKVLCHLPLHKALPEHMSAVLHSVNRLRFYRTSDISNRARSLLSRWSKIFARSQDMKKHCGVRSSSDAQDMILKQSIDEIMGKEIWLDNNGNSDDISALSSEGFEHVRKMETSQPLKLLPAPADDPSRKQVLGVSQSHTRERRKVQLVEQPGQRTAGRNPQAAKAASVSQGRPMSADDIQKAKLRAQYMQSKYGKPGSSYNGSNSLKNEGSSKPPISNSSASKSPVRPKIEDLKKPMTLSPNISSKLEEAIEPKIKVDPMVPPSEFCCRVQVPWQMPPEIKLNSLWRVGIGENSKEVDVQKNRNRREIETIYRTLQEIPSNPKGPWDIEMDYDDTLTPEIPIEQPPDADGSDTQASPNEHINTAAPSVSALPEIAGVSGAEPDLELLAVLLKNPEVVFALTSGQAGNLTKDETVKLLDLIKTGGTGLGENLGGKAENKVEVSLPSPTPSSNPATSGGRQEVMKHPFAYQSSTGNRVAYPDSAAITVTSLTQYQHHQATHISIPQQQASMPLLSTQVPVAMPPFSLPQTTARTHEKPASSMVYTSNLSHPNNSSMLQQAQASEMVLSMKNLPITGHSLPDYSVSTGPSMQMENPNKIKPGAPSASYTVGGAERRQVPLPLPTMMSTPTRSSFHQPHVNESPHVYTSRLQSGNVGPTPDSWVARKGLPSNSFSQVNQNNYGASFGGHLQPQLQSGPPGSDEGFESWSPDNSPVRSSGYVQGGSYLEPRANSGGNYMPDNRPRQRNSSGYWDNTRQAGRRWR